MNRAPFSSKVYTRGLAWTLPCFLTMRSTERACCELRPYWVRSHLAFLRLTNTSAAILDTVHTGVVVGEAGHYEGQSETMLRALHVVVRLVRCTWF